MLKKLLIILMTIIISVGSLSCSAGYREKKSFLSEESVTTKNATAANIEAVSEKSVSLFTAAQEASEAATEPFTNAKEVTETVATTVVTEREKETEIETTKTAVTTTKASVTSANGKSLGEFKITVYTPDSDGGVWGYQTATGVRSQHLSTCAVDPDVIPLGSTIQIDGLTLLACDTGSAVQGNVIDIFYDGSDGEACEWVSNFGTYHNVQKL